MSQINYDDIIEQLKSELGVECAIANRYGIVLSSLLNEFAKGNVIPQKILEVITEVNEIATDLNLEEIKSFAFEAQEFNFLFTFSEKLILITKASLSVNLAKFMPSIRIFTQKLSEGAVEEEVQNFSTFDFSKEISKIETTLSEEKTEERKFAIIKDLIKFISK